VFLVLIAGIVGGGVLAAAAGARRTASAYDRLLTASGSPHEVIFAFGQEQIGTVESWLSHATSVDRFEPAVGMIGRRAPTQDWYSLYAPRRSNGLLSEVIEQGRRPRSDRADEVLITLRTARNAGLEIGDRVQFHAYGPGQIETVFGDPWTPPDGVRISVRVVGIARDPTDAQLSQTIKLMFGTPAFARLHARQAALTLIPIWLQGGPDNAPAFQRELEKFSRTFPGGEVPFDEVSSREDADAANHSANAVVAGLLIVALVAGLAGLVTISQAVRRYLGGSDNERDVLASLGARRIDRTATHLVTAIPFLAAVPFVAAGVAFAVSPLFPVGAARTLEPHPGLDADLLVLIGGAVAWLAVVAVLTATVAWSTSTRPRRSARPARSNQLATTTAGSTALPLAIGARFGLWPRARRRASQRTALVGIVVAVAGVVGSLLFAASVDDFTSTPARFGVTFDLALELPRAEAPRVVNELAADRDLVAVAAARSGNATVDGRTVEAYNVEPIKGALSPVVRSGRLPTGSSELAVGPKLLSTLGKQVGDSVKLATNRGERLVTIVGTVFAPAVDSSAFNGEVVLTRSGLDAAVATQDVSGIARVRRGVDRDAVLAGLDTRYAYGVNDESVPNTPGPIRNLEQIADLPLVLALFFAFLGAAALGHTLLTTANDRRRDIAVLRALGFTPRQAATVVAGSGTGVAFVALALGIPIGIIAGNVGWSAVARGLYVDPATVVPLLAIAAAGAGLIVLANLVALVPARRVRRRSPGTALRAE
jgi:predicted lysophospholipase L1 biosynthesis ABC-type transport system permease subunit